MSDKPRATTPKHAQRSPERARSGTTAGTPGRTRLVNGVLVARPQGVFDRRALRWIDRLVTDADDTPLVIELDECILAEESAVARLTALRWPEAKGRVCVVCNRPSGRTLLLRLGVSDRLALFTHTQDALTAWALAHAGYGAGWGPRSISQGPGSAPKPLAELLGASPTPDDFPVITDIDLAVRHEARTEGKTGDFWDVFPATSTTYCALLGDVTGSGPHAAAIAGLARHRTRTTARHDARPDRVLELLNASLLRDDDEHRILTAVFARFRRHHDTIRVQLARAGHPYPLVVHGDGTGTVIQTPGQLLGAFEAPRIDLATVVLRSGDALVLVTDGITDARLGSGGSELGFDGLLDILLPAAGRRAVDIAATAFTVLERNDDAAVLVLANPDLG